MWPMRSSPGLSVRGGRGGIMDRGRGRGRGAYHSVSGGGFSRPSLFPDEDGGRILGGRVSSTLVNGKQIVFNSLSPCSLYFRANAGWREMARIPASGPRVCSRPVRGRSTRRTDAERALRVGDDPAGMKKYHSSSGAAAPWVLENRRSGVSL